MKNTQKGIKRNQLYTELLKMGLSWSVNTSNNPVAKTTKPKQNNLCSSSAMTLAEPCMLQQSSWPTDFFPSWKRTIVMSILYISGAVKGKENYYQLLFYSSARLQGLLSQWCSSTWQISSSMLFAVMLSKTMRIGASWLSFVPSRNIFFFFYFRVAWLNRPPFRWGWNPRAADTGMPVKDTL